MKCEFNKFCSIPQAVSQDGAPPQQQPTKLESFFAITKSLIIRALIIYFVSSFLRKPATTPTEVNPNAPGGAPPPTRLPATNFFQNGTLFDFHVYISEDQFNVNFSDTNSLIWYQEGLTYGDWYGGRNGDGTVTHHTEIRASERLQVKIN